MTFLEAVELAVQYELAGVIETSAKDDDPLSVDDAFCIVARNAYDIKHL